MSEPIVLQVDDVYELNELSQFMKDKDFDWVLNTVLKLTAKPDVPGHLANPMIVQLQSYSTKFRIQAKYHMLFNKTDEGSKRKNILLTTADAVDKLVDSLKYLSRRT